MDGIYTFTVFTATYNRWATLPRVYESLKKQTYRNFEWLIVDDGSTDNTREIVEGWIFEAAFPIRYVYQEHGHKKAAFNRGVHEARGSLFLTLDSDDECAENALERFWWHWNNIPTAVREQYSAVTALWVYAGGGLVGTAFPGDGYLDSDSIEIHRRWKVKGDKWGFQRTDILRDCAFHEDLEGFVPEGLVWIQIAEKYKTRYVNEALGICHQDNPEGAASRITQGRDPILHASGLFLWAESVFKRQWRYFREDPPYFVHTAINFVRFRLHTRGLSLTGIAALPGAWLLFAMIPAGYAAYWMDRWRHRAGSARKRSGASAVNILAKQQAVRGRRALRIGLVISSLRAGGSERVASILATIWSEQHIEVTLLTAYPRETDFYRAPDTVRRLTWGYIRETNGDIRRIAGHVRRLARLRTAIRQARPDILVSFGATTNLMTLVS
ncbi:MAG: glycosyltransferase, partial [Bryobacteraceae bacterium]